jgi:hypothetical protein
MANQAKERTGGSKKVDETGNRASDSCQFSGANARGRSGSESTQSHNPTRTSIPNVFSFMELPESQNINTIYWQRQEWLRQQAEQRGSNGTGTQKIDISERPRKASIANSEKRDSPVSSDSGIGLESELADIPEQGHDASVDDALPKTTARAAFAPLLRGISQRSAQRPQSLQSESPLECSTPVSSSSPEQSLATPRPIVHHSRPDLAEKATPAIRPRSLGIGPIKAELKGPEKRVISGYEHFASKLSAFVQVELDDQSFVPVYRRFDRLNQRLFLHLQDEIVEIEDELRQIDDADARLRAVASPSEGHELPESRRFGANAKVDVLGRAYLKLGQYNQALLSYNKLIQNMEVAHSSDVERLKLWLTTENPVKNTEATFLDHHDDLLALCKKTETRPQHIGASIKIPDYLQQPAAIRISVLVLLSIFAFRLVSSFLGRLAVVALCALASLAIQQPESSENGDSSKCLIL